MTSEPTHTISRTPTGEPPYYVKALAMGIPALLIGIQISLWAGFFALPDAVWTRADFRDLYTSGYMLRTGMAAHMYDYDFQRQLQNQLVSERTSLLAFDHLAYEAVLFVPFSFLSYRTAYFSFMAWNALLYAACYWVLRPFLGQLSRIWKLLPVCLFLGFLPPTITLMLGQDSILMLLLFALAVVRLEREHELTAGALIGLAFFKFHIVLPIGFLFLAWRRWRVVMGITVSAAAVVLASFLLIGTPGVRAYFGLLTSLSGASEQYKYGLTTIAMPTLRGLISGVVPARVGIRVQKTVTIVVSVIIMLWLAWRARNASRGSYALLIAIPGAILVSYHILIQDLCMLLIPISLCLNRYAVWQPDLPAANWTVAASAALLLFAPSLLFLSTSYFCFMAVPVALFLVIVVAGLRAEARWQTATF